jgi:hypothetical protein
LKTVNTDSVTFYEKLMLINKVKSSGRVIDLREEKILKNSWYIFFKK